MSLYGKELWQVPWETNHGVNATTPLVYNNIVFHTSAYGMGGQAIEVDSKGYKVLWKSDVIGAHHSDPILIDGYMYGYSGESTRNKGEFKCVDVKTGKEVWSTDEIGLGTTVYVDGHFVCQDLKGNLFILKATPEKFQKIGEIPEIIKDVSNLAWTTPVIANGKLYLRYLQHLACFDLVN